MKNKTIRALAISGFTVLTASAAHALSSYSVYDLSSSGNQILTATGINDAGQVVGTYNNPIAPNTQRAYITGPNGIGLTDTGGLATSNKPLSWAQAVNNAGQVVGFANSSSDPLLPVHAFMTGPNGAGMIDVNPQAGIISYAIAINEAGQVAGYFMGFDGSHSAFITGPNGVGGTVLSSLGSGNTVAGGINEAGQVAGSSIASDGLSHAFITGPNGVGITDIGTPGVTSIADDINDAGQVIGSYKVNGEWRPFITGPNGIGMIDLGTLGGAGGMAFAANNAGEVVGGANIADGHSRAFVTDANGANITDLNTLLIAVLADGSYLSNAYGINASGQIIASDNKGRSYLLTPVGPVPLPASAWLMFSSLGGLAALARKRR
jgi:probable HAF family extracellular repeat protein